MNRLLSYCRSILPARLEAAHSASDSVRVIPSFHMSLRGDGRKKPEISLHLGCLVEKVSWKEPVRVSSEASGSAFQGGTATSLTTLRHSDS